MAKVFRRIIAPIIKAIEKVVEVVIGVFSPPSYDMPNADSAAASSQNAGVLLNKQGTDNAIPVVYGQRKLGGTRVFAGTNGTENRNLYIALVLCEGQINGITKVYIDDTLVWSGSVTSHGGRYEANTSNYKSYFTFETFHGTTDQTVSPLMKEAAGYADTQRLRGLAYLACKCSFPDVKSNEDAKKNPWGGFPNIAVEIQGKQVRYPSNLGITYAGLSYTDRQNFSNYFNTTGYSNNPVDCILDYLRDTTYGKGLGDTQIDWHSFYAARVRWTKGENGSTLADDKTHKTNGIIFTDRTVMDNVKTFLLNMRSSLVYQDGKYRLVVVDNGSDSSIYYAASTSVMTITEDDIIDGISIGVETGDSKYNRMVVTYMGGKDGTGELTYEPADYTYPDKDSPLKNTYLTQDNNRVVETKITLEHITDGTTAAKLAQILVDRSRYKGKTISFTGTARLFQLEVGDVITLTYQSLSINSQYRVKDIIQNADFTFQITVEEHNDVVYAYNPNTVVVPKMRYVYLEDPVWKGIIDNPGFIIWPFPVYPRIITLSDTTTVTPLFVSLTNVTTTIDRLDVTYITPTDSTLIKFRIYSYDYASSSWQQFGEVPFVHSQVGNTYNVTYGFIVPAGIKTWVFRIHTVDINGNESAATNYQITNTGTTPGQQSNGVTF
jgi:hypothetical protein